MSIVSNNIFGAYSRYRRKRRRYEFGSLAMEKLLSDYKFDSVLDIGAGSGRHSDIFLKNNKAVSAIDVGRSEYFELKESSIATIIGDFNQYGFEEKFDCVWACHVLEHQINAGLFLKKIHSTLNEGGVLAITVPPLKTKIVGGHVSLWNAGLLLYNLVLAGFNCKEASVLRYGYNISVILKKKSIELPELAFDKGDIRKILRFLPDGLNEPFDGEIWDLNW
jgi:SAM-dependent methyltransferase